MAVNLDPMLVNSTQRHERDIASIDANLRTRGAHFSNTTHEIGEGEVDFVREFKRDIEYTHTHTPLDVVFYDRETALALNVDTKVLRYATYVHAYAICNIDDDDNERVGCLHDIAVDRMMRRLCLHSLSFNPTVHGDARLVFYYKLTASSNYVLAVCFDIIDAEQNVHNLVHGVHQALEKEYRQMIADTSTAVNARRTSRWIDATSAWTLLLDFTETVTLPSELALLRVRLADAYCTACAMCQT